MIKKKYYIIDYNNYILPSNNINIINYKRKLHLPKIKKKFYPFQNDIKMYNNLSTSKKSKTKYQLSIPVFLTSNNNESEKNFLSINLKGVSSNKKIYKKDENETILNLLNNKITINNKHSPKENKKKELKRDIILKKYMNEAILYRKSFFQNKQQVGKVLNIQNYFKNNDKVIINDNKRTIDINDNNDMQKMVKRMKKFKTQDKNIELNNSIDYLAPNLKKRNCNLKFNYYRNKKEIIGLESIFKSLEEKAKKEFNGFKKETDNIFTNIYYDKNLDIII